MTRVGEVDPDRGQVLAEHPVRDGAPELGLPPVLVLAGVRVHRLVRTAVTLAVGLLVALEMVGPYGDRDRHRVLEDAGDQLPAQPGVGARSPDVHRADMRTVRVSGRRHRHLRSCPAPRDTTKTAGASPAEEQPKRPREGCHTEPLTSAACLMRRVLIPAPNISHRTRGQEGHS